MRIAITTSGGDAPALNAVIRAATCAGIESGHEMFGIRNGFTGLLRDDEAHAMSLEGVRDIDRAGGTILGAQSGGDPFKDPDALDRILARLRRHRIDALVMAGGDGTMGIAHRIAQCGVRVVGVPKTIDRDVCHTYKTFGFDTAVQTASDAISRIHSTANSHDRLMVVEVMGRDAGWVALFAGLGGGAHLIAIPEVEYRIEDFAAHIRAREARGERYHILVCAEGARPLGGDASTCRRTGRYGGVAEMIARDLGEATGKEARAMSLAHLLRGGPPVVSDQILGLRFGAAAIRALNDGARDAMISFQPPHFVPVPLADIAGRTNCVALDAPEIETALQIGINLGRDPVALREQASRAAGTVE